MTSTNMKIVSTFVLFAACAGFCAADDSLRPLNVNETRAFIRELTEHAVKHHMKTGDSPQKGMMYEYLWWKNRGKANAFIQGEALDTMHDGAWFGNAMVNAYRATGDVRYKEILVKWQLPFYLKMLNQSKDLFSSEKVHVWEKGRNTWRQSKQWLLQGQENGFVPYWWDDGGSVSLDMLAQKSGELVYPGTNELAGSANPTGILKGWSHGSSNHLAEDVAILLQQSSRIFAQSKAPEELELLRQCAVGARHLQDCRARHDSPKVQPVMAACASLNADAAMMKLVHTWDDSKMEMFANHYTHAIKHFKPSEKVPTPAFADDGMYDYYTAIAKHKTLPPKVALKLAFDAYTLPLLWQIYHDDGPVPPGINRFDLTALFFVDGKPQHYASERKGPRGGPLPIGSRMGPQNMAVCGWVLQAIQQDGAYARIPDQVKSEVEKLTNMPCPHPDIKAWMTRELGCGLRSWENIFRQYGYIPTGIGCQDALPGLPWDELSDTGGYAHLITAASMWLMVLDGKKDW